MFKLSYDQIVDKIVEKEGISKEEVEKKVKNKMESLKGMISKEGAAHIISNELGIKLFDFDKKNFKIKEMVAGLRNIKVDCKVIKKYEIREFENENRKGKFATLLIGDETGTCRAVIWDENLMEVFEKIKEEDTISLENCYVRQNNDFREIHMGSESQIRVNPEGVKIDKVMQEEFKITFDRKKIKDLNAGEFAGVFATIVQVFDPRFYDACPECNKKVNLEGEKQKCGQHGIVKAKQIPILNVHIDDGTDNMRTVSFGERVYSVLEMNEKEFGKLKQDSFEPVKSKLLGKQMIFNGKVNRNSMFDTNEMILSSVEEADPKEMTEEILG